MWQFWIAFNEDETEWVSDRFPFKTNKVPKLPLTLKWLRRIVLTDFLSCFLSSHRMPWKRRTTLMRTTCKALLAWQQQHVHLHPQTTVIPTILLVVIRLPQMHRADIFCMFYIALDHYIHVFLFFEFCLWWILDIIKKMSENKSCEFVFNTYATHAC